MMSVTTPKPKQTPHGVCRSGRTFRRRPAWSTMRRIERPRRYGDKPDQRQNKASRKSRPLTPAFRFNPVVSLNPCSRPNIGFARDGKAMSAKQLPAMGWRCNCWARAVQQARRRPRAALRRARCQHCRLRIQPSLLIHPSHHESFLLPRAKEKYKHLFPLRAVFCKRAEARLR